MSDLAVCPALSPVTCLASIADRLAIVYDSGVATTMTQALSRVREQIDESSAAHWTQAELRRWIMEGANDIARRTRCLRGKVTVTSVAGQADYTVSTRLVEITHAEYLGTGWTVARPLTYIDVSTKASFGYAPSIFPAFYTTWGEPPSLTLTLHPAPATSSESIYLYYYRLPTAIDYAGSQDANTVEIPEGWDDLLYLYAESCALRRDRDSEAWQAARQDYESKLAELASVSVRYNDQTGQIMDEWSQSEWWFGPYGRGR